jgi:hypothetical protein
MNTDEVPELGDVRFTEDGTIEVYDGEMWTTYQPPADTRHRVVFRGDLPPRANEPT